MFERAAGARAHDARNSGFFVFSHARVRPLTYHEPIRFETMLRAHVLPVHFHDVVGGQIASASPAASVGPRNRTCYPADLILNPYFCLNYSETGSAAAQSYAQTRLPPKWPARGLPLHFTAAHVTRRNGLLRTHPRHSASRERALYFAGPRCCVQAPSGAFSRASGSCAPANHRRSNSGSSFSAKRASGR